MKIAVIGAGIVGISSANWLQKYGQDVTLFDMNDPGSQASFGNAGTYARYANIPTNSSSFFYLFPYLLLNKNSPLFIRFKRLNKTLPWILNYLYNCRNSNVNTTTNNLTKLLSKMDDGYEELFKEAGVEPYLSRKAIMYGWSTKLFFNSAKKDFSKRERTGIKIQVLSHDEISDLEPNINNIFYKGALFEGSYFAKNPKKVSQLLINLFVNKGGIFKKEKVTNIENVEKSKLQIITGSTSEVFDRVIIASGVWSKSLVEATGDKVPLEAERGYHIVNPELKDIISRPISWQERGTYFTPMEDGLRTGGIVEFGDTDYEENPKVINFLERALKSIFPQSNRPTQSWVGFRPSVPDSLPVIGQSSKNPYIYYCFGHQHIGWSLGGISGKLIAQKICANKTDIDLAPYSLERL